MIDMKSPYDTVPREPLFAWWLWLLFKAGATGFLAVRTWTVLWFVPTALLLWTGARRLLGPWAWVALVLYVAMPAQIAIDANGERHVVETFFTLLLWNNLFILGLPEKGRTAWQSALALGGMFLTRINLGVSAVLSWLPFVRSKAQLKVLVVCVGTALLLLIPHFMANKRKTGDPFHSINIHSYWFSNKEFIGRPGFPATEEEWLKDVYKPGLTYRQWAFKAHSFHDYVLQTVLGYESVIVDHFISFHLAVKVPPWIRGWLAFCLAVGLIAGIFIAPFRGSLAYLACLIFPFAFVCHVHMAARFYAHMAPLIFLFIALGHKNILGTAFRFFQQARASRMEKKP
jgi:hypothetical protein